MSGREIDENGAELPEPEALAAEYVLGTLPRSERAAAEARIARDPDFAAAVARWQAHFAPLDAGYAETPPPREVFARIEARLHGQPARRPRWQIPVLGGALAAMAMALVLTLAPLTAPPANLAATLAGEEITLTAAYTGEDGLLTLVRTAGPAPAEGQAYELWKIDETEVPASLGLLAEGPIPVPGLKAGDILAVSVEPAGGSPTGQPTGPVLASAILTRP